MSIALVVTRGYGNGTFTGAIADVATRGYSIGDEIVIPEPSDTGPGVGATVLRPAGGYGPRARYRSKDEIEAILAELLAETREVLDKKVPPRKKPAAVKKAVIAATPEQLDEIKARQLQAIWDEGAQAIAQMRGVEAEAARMARDLAEHFRLEALRAEEDDIETLLLLGVL